MSVIGILLLKIEFKCQLGNINAQKQYKKVSSEMVSHKISSLYEVVISTYEKRCSDT